MKKRSLSIQRWGLFPKHMAIVMGYEGHEDRRPELARPALTNDCATMDNTAAACGCIGILQLVLRFASPFPSFSLPPTGSLGPLACWPAEFAVTATDSGCR